MNLTHSSKNKQASKQATKQASNQASKQASKQQTNKQTSKQASKQATNKQTSKQANKLTDRPELNGQEDRRVCYVSPILTETVHTHNSGRSRVNGEVLLHRKRVRGPSGGQINQRDKRGADGDESRATHHNLRGGEIEVRCVVARLDNVPKNDGV